METEILFSKKINVESLKPRPTLVGWVAHWFCSNKAAGAFGILIMKGVGYETVS